MPLNSSPNKFETERHDVITANLPSPAPGAACLWPVPANLVVHIVAIQFRVTTNAVAGNRWASVTVFNPVTFFTIHQNPAMELQPPNTDRFYSMNPDWLFLTLAPVIGVRIGPLNPFLILHPPEQLVLFCENIDPGDQIQNIRIRYREWKED